MVDDYDLDKDGKLDAEEREIYLEDRRRRMEDEDAKRDAQRNMTWFALSGMVLILQQYYMSSNRNGNSSRVNS